MPNPKKAPVQESPALTKEKRVDAAVEVADAGEAGADKGGSGDVGKSGACQTDDCRVTGHEE